MEVTHISSSFVLIALDKIGNPVNPDNIFLISP